MNDLKKVYMILTNGFDPDVRVYKEAKYLVEKGYEVTILCWDRKCEYVNQFEEKPDGIEIKRFSIPSKPGTGIKQLFPYLNFIFTVRKYLKDKKYTYIHCHDFDGMIVGMLTKRKKQKKLIFDMHEIYTNYAYAKNGLFKLFFNKILNEVDYIIYVNNEQIKNIKQKEKLVFLPNYPDEQVYLPINKKKDEKIRINYIGSLRDYDSLKTLAEIGKENSNLKIGFYGMGVCQKELEEEYENSPVKIYGKYDGTTESGEIYRNTDILYCSYNPNIQNWKTAYPVKLYEAIITITPIIVSKNTVVGEFVEEHKIGETIEYSDKVSILQAIQKIQNNYNEYVENINKIANEYKWENIVPHLENIYGG